PAESAGPDPRVPRVPGERRRPNLLRQRAPDGGRRRVELVDRCLPEHRDLGGRSVGGGTACGSARIAAVLGGFACGPPAESAVAEPYVVPCEFTPGAAGRAALRPRRRPASYRRRLRRGRADEAPRTFRRPAQQRDGWCPHVDPA